MKLPINLFLWVGSLGLLGGSGWHFYSALRQPPGPSQDDVTKQVQGLVDKGKGKQVVVQGPDYSTRQPWERFKTANLIGKITVTTPDPTPVQPVNQVEQAPPQKPLEEIFAIVCLVAEGEKSRAIIRYVPSANVEPPPESIPPPAGPLDLAAAAHAAKAATPKAPNAPGSKAAPPMPVAPPSSTPGAWVHHLQLEDHLWKPYEHIRFVRVEPDASAAWFQREEPGKDKSEWKEEKLIPDELGLSQEVLEALRAGGIVTSTSDKPVGDQPASPVEPTTWQTTETTRKVGRSEWHIGTQDRDVFRGNPERIFNEDVATSSYSSGHVKGVQITRMAPRFQSYGIVEGDVVVSINGRAVTSKTQAFSVGKDLYKRGVRTFEVEFLSRGRRIVRTYVAPDE
jgi:hypothetical protein